LSTIIATPQNIEEEQLKWKPSFNPWLVAASVMISTFMVALDSSVANVALPHIAGNLSASTDESTWVLTSYLVSNGIMLPASGWLSRRIGRKRLLILSVLAFTGASLLCGVAAGMPMLVVARVLQGLGGGCMLPLAQSILLESFPPRLHGTAMAVFGIGTVVAPVIGPTLGGWITDSYSWRWIFYINLPIGMLALSMINRFVEDPPYLRRARGGAIDYAGFLLMAVWLGTLQLVLDKGQEDDWFATGWICWFSAISVICLLGFIVRELSSREPIVQLRILGNRNFLAGTIITGLYGFVLYGVTALLPLFLQTVLDYSAKDSGFCVSPRGFGSLIAMVVVGILVNYVDTRILLVIGFTIFGYSTIVLSHINLGIAMGSVVWPNFFNGFGGGFIFVPLTTTAMGMLRKEEIGNASGIYNLMRNIGGSIGIASVTTMLVRGTQAHQNFLAANLTAGNSAGTQMLAGMQTKFCMGGASVFDAHREAMGALYRSMQQQASLLAYADNFQRLAIISLFCIPPALFLQRLRHRSHSAEAETGEH
jgi:DHA2 family multidrug resistance protein